MNVIKFYYFIICIICCVIQYYIKYGFAVLNQTKKKVARNRNTQKFFVILGVQNIMFAHSENKANIFECVMKINCDISVHYVE
jgi:hypothetical protein